MFGAAAATPPRHRTSTSDLPASPWGLLEPDARKRASPVLRGAERSNALGLPGELIGNFSASGREWEPKDDPTRTNVHDFIDKKLGKVAPYGVYDIAANTGWVNVGTDADTGQFAVQSIRRWWITMGTEPTPPRPGC